MCDFGGNTAVVRSQLARDAAARRAGVSIVPDCGMGPGLNVSLATYVMSLLDQPREVLIWDGGLPQRPEPPWNYAMTFNIGGLTNEYDGHAYFLRDGKVVEVPCFDGYEVLEFDAPIGGARGLRHIRRAVHLPLDLRGQAPAAGEQDPALPRPLGPVQGVQRPRPPGDGARACGA